MPASPQASGSRQNAAGPSIRPSSAANDVRQPDTISHEPAPGITATASHTNSHVLPRRFLGSMPENVVNSAEAEERHKRFASMRGAAVQRIRASAVGQAGVKGVGAVDDRRRRVLGRLKEIRRLSRAGSLGGDVDADEVDLDDGDTMGEDVDDEDAGGWHIPLPGKGKKRKKRKDVWIGESFDIGREFRTEGVRQVDDQESRKDAVRDGEGRESMPPSSPLDRSDGLPANANSGDSLAPSRAASAPPKVDLGSADGTAQSSTDRPAPSRATTQDTFVTARTRFSDAQSQASGSGSASTSRNASTTDLVEPLKRPSTGDEHHYELSGLSNGSAISPRSHAHDTESSARPDQSQDAMGLSPTMAPSISRQSGTSSMHPLISAPETPISESPDSTLSPTDPGPSGGGAGSGSRAHKGRSYSPSSPRTIGAGVSGIRGKLKSALRRPSAPPHTELEDGEVDTGARDGNRALARDQTRAKTVQFPVDLDDVPGVMRRQIRKGNKRPASPEDVLAREGDEAEGTSAGAVQEAMAEEQGDEESDAFLPGQVVMRDRVLVKVGFNREQINSFDEAAQSTPLKERLVGHKKLAYIIPLNPSRSSLTIYNKIDMTISLTTSSEKLSQDFDDDFRAQTARGTKLRNRLRDSRQAKWLLDSRKQTQIFIVKFAERSRALDWYWQLWREFGGELPPRLDVVVPAFATTLRLPMPEDPDEVGGRTTRAAMNRASVTRLARDAIASAVDTERLLEGRRTEMQLELTWKSADGHLDWVNWDTTVQGKKRDWAVLAGLAKLQSEKNPEALQLRPASHRVKAIKLQDGTVLDEPPGVEGYLTRHTGGSTPKEEIYASTHDGYIFIASKSNANPPLDPGKEGATPADIFPDVYDAFNETEHRRMARLVEHCTGCVDLRDIVTVRLLTDDADTDADADGSPGDIRQKFKGKNLEQWFEVRLAHGIDATMKSVVVEAHDKDVAREWVDSLTKLAAYWRHRHRVDARMRMDVDKMHSAEDPFAGTPFGAGTDALLSDMWDWLFLRKGKWSKFRSRLIVLAGGCLIAFKVRGGEPLCTRKQRYPLYGAYTYSGMLAQAELHDSGYESAFTSEARVYQDGLQNTDGLEDRTFCVRLAAKPSYWGKDRTYPWNVVQDKGWSPMKLSDQPPFLLIFRARSKLERDRWIWAINAEMERQVRANVSVENASREHGVLP